MKLEEATRHTKRMWGFCRHCNYHYPLRQLAEQVLTPMQVKHGGWASITRYRRAYTRMVEQHLKVCPVRVSEAS